MGKGKNSPLINSIESFDKDFGLDELILLSNKGQIRRLILTSDDGNVKAVGIYG